MIVYNINPEGTKPIFIVTNFERDPYGGPGIIRNQISIGPGEAIDLSLIGLEPKKESHEDL